MQITLIKVIAVKVIAVKVTAILGEKGPSSSYEVCDFHEKFSVHGLTQRPLKLRKDTYSHVAPGVASKSGTEFGAR